MSAGFDIRVEGLCKTFEKGGQELKVLRDLDLHLHSGERVAIVGQSGSGKSTFLHVLGTLDRPTSGQIWFGDRRVFSRSDAELDALRNREIGFVFQFHHLMPDQDALHNVMLPALIGGDRMPTARKRATELLQRVGLGERLRHKPGELSGGEQQRVAIARALVRRPSLVLADEPTGNLDPGTSGDIFEMLMELNAEEGTTLIVVTHSMAIADRFERCLRLVDGQFAPGAPATVGGSA
ncbi:MAG TPA: lipoprotein-releasing system ATP-binding protein LolD [Deltaproteobacteria bacterium]|nr:lipoprotein-releasing system ATP-binding protein LolD [Deltaproteobacteria bacterium]